MEFDTKYRESVLNHQPLLLKPELIEDDLAFESCSSKGFIQDLHQFDQFLLNGQLLTPELNVQTMSFDPFNPLLGTHGYSTDLTFYELKPFADQSGGNGAAMQSFQGGGAYWNPRKTNIDMIPPDRTRSVPLNYCQDIKRPMNFVVPDESSCITAENGYYKQVRMKKNTVSGLTEKPCKGRRKSNSIKGQWTVEEDRHLIHLVEKYGMRKWSHIAQMLKGRIGKQCRERWHNHLRPDIKKDVWSEEEDKILIQAHAEVGNKWAEIAKRLPGRTENSIKNHWNATKRRQYSRRKCRSKYPRPSSLLQNYIKSLNLDGKDSSNGKINSSSDGLRMDEMMEAPTQAAAETLELCFTTTEGLVPNYQFNKEVPAADFAFDANLFEESSIDSLLDELPCGPVGDEKCFDMELMPLDTASLMQFEVKKEMDLVEMISHVNL